MLEILEIRLLLRAAADSQCSIDLCLEYSALYIVLYHSCSYRIKGRYSTELLSEWFILCKTLQNSAAQRLYY